MFSTSYWDPFSTLGFRELSRALSEAPRTKQSAPHADFRETKEAFTFVFEVPGLAEADVELEVHDKIFTVRAERKHDTPEGFTAHRIERPSFRLAQSFQLPTRVDSDLVQATLTDGVLTVTLPKAAEAQPRRIEIKTATQQVQS